MREIISCHIGQAGVQLSSTLWELLCTEHGIQSDGNLMNEDIEDMSFQTFFQEIPSGQFVPRAILVDLEPTVIDEIRSGPYRKLFHPDQLISGCEDAANNFARGHFTLGKEHIDYTISRIRKIVDMCDSLEGFFVTHSSGGGTGSGFSSLLFERLSVEFTKKNSLQICVYPGERLACAAVEPYNTVLSGAFTIDHTDLTNIFDNESVYNICSKNLDIPRPSFSNLNRVISQIMSSLTVSIRFQGYLNAEMDQMITNLVPYPRIHFPIFSHAPLVCPLKANHSVMTVLELCRGVFDPNNQLVSVVMEDGKYMSCCLQFRGKITPREANEALFDIKRRTDIKFVDWCPTGFKLGLNNQPPAYVPKSEICQTDKSLTMLTNSTSISQKFISICKKFDILFKKKCFVFWYVGEGMEELELQDAREEMENISKDYEELVKETEHEVEEEESKPPPSTTTSTEKKESTEEEKEEEKQIESAESNEEDAGKKDDDDDDDKKTDAEEEDKDDDDDEEESGKESETEDDDDEESESETQDEYV